MLGWQLPGISPSSRAHTRTRICTHVHTHWHTRTHTLAHTHTHVRNEKKAAQVWKANRPRSRVSPWTMCILSSVVAHSWSSEKIPTRVIKA